MDVYKENLQNAREVVELILYELESLGTKDVALQEQEDLWLRVYNKMQTLRKDVDEILEIKTDHQVWKLGIPVSQAYLNQV